MKKIFSIVLLAVISIATTHTTLAQEVLTNQSILSLVTAKVDNGVIINKIKGSDNKFDLSTDGMIGLKQGKVNEKIMEEMLLAAKDLPVLKNADIISMHTNGISRKIILSKINLSECNFSTNTDDLIALKSAGVHEEVTKVMMDPETSAGSATLITGKLPPHPQTIAPPKSLPSSGIYYEAYTPSTDYIPLEPSTTNQTKSGTFGEAMGNRYTMGLTGTSKKVGLTNKSSNTVIQDVQPVFYFSLERSGKSIDEVAESGQQGVSSPNDFVLIRAKVTKRGREIEIGRTTSVGSESGFANGTIPFRFKKISDMLYRVYFEKELPAGEYAFYYNKGSEQNKSLKLFDFSLRNNVTVN